MPSTSLAPIAASTGLSQAPNPLDQFLAGQLSPRTQRAYRADLEQFFATVFGDEPVDLDLAQRVTFHEVIAFRNHLAEGGYKRATINRKLASLKAFFRMLVAAGLIEQNPADSALVRGYKQEHNPAGKTLSTNALQTLIDHIKADEDDLKRTRDLAVVHLLMYGGLRRSEAAAMQWEDLRQEGPFYVLTLPQTKSGLPQDVKLQAVVVHHLMAYRQVLETAGYPGQGPVFLSLSRNQSRGRPLTDHAINRIVKKRALEAGIAQNITAHMFRHTCCTLAIEGGARPQQVQAHLRHKDLKTTMLYYENREKLTDNASDYIHLR